MRLYFSPRAQELLADPAMGPFMKPVIHEALDYGLDQMRLSNNPFYLQAKSVLWWVPLCSLAIFCCKEGDDSEYALIFENPHHPQYPDLDPEYFEALREYSQEITVV